MCARSLNWIRLRHLPGGTDEKYEKPQSVAEIRSEHLPNAGPGRYRCVNPLGDDFVRQQGKEVERQGCTCSMQCSVELGYPPST